MTHNIGWVNVGIDHDTSAFAVESVRRWWYSMGKDLYPDAKQLMVTADGGGSNGYRIKLWKLELQKLADETGLSIQVSHFPPGTSKWNKIEHRRCSREGSRFYRRRESGLSVGRVQQIAPGYCYGGRW
jgi:hypothetical protein